MPLTAKASALRALYRNCLFRSDAPAETHAHVAREFVDHMLRWKRGRIDSAMFKGELRRLKMYVLHYGAEVEVTPQPFHNFALVHTSIAGGAEIESDGRRLEVPEGHVAVISPTRSLRLRWYPGTQQMILRVPHALMREVRGLGEGDDLGLAPGYVVPQAFAAQWDLIAQSLLGAMALPEDSNVDESWLEHFERNVALFLLSHQGTPASAPPARAADADEGESRGSSASRMQRIVDYMDSRLCAPISLDDLARAGGVSLRTLNELCHRYHGLTPMELLRNRRLDGARSRLRMEPDLRVTEGAIAYGFGHLGRFSRYYFERFDELPHQTQAASRR